MKALRQFENAFGIRLTPRKHREILLLLMCTELVLAFSYLGYIQIAPISVTTMHILVIAAAMLFGPWDALAVSLVFAVTSMWKATVTSVEIGDIVFSPVLSGQPLESLLMAVGARAAFALAAGFLFRRFFAKKRKHNYLGIAAISLVATLLHNLLVYLCMIGFFGASDVETSTGFSAALVLNNLLLFVVTIAVMHLFRKTLAVRAVRNFIKKISLEESESSRKRSRAVWIVYLMLFFFCVFIALHFMNRLGVFIQKFGGNVTEEYLSWTNALLLQFIVGFAGVFGILTVTVRWIQEYYSAMTLEANIRARENAEIANKSKSAFLFNMSHDIRTPMNAILGYTDIALRNTGDSEKVTDSLQKIKTSGNHLLNLINDILEMSRIEAGKVELTDSPIYVPQALEEVCEMCQTLADAKDIRFETDFGVFENPYVYADELHANEVLINLISNAVKYTNPGGTVRFSVHQPGKEEQGRVLYRFEIADTGIGMSEEFQQHLFEAFSREKTATVSKQEGTGLGLSIVKKIMDLAGGTVKVQSTLGEGSTFVLDVPLRVMDEKTVREFTKEKADAEAIRSQTVLNGKKVLLVEDNDFNREIAAELLKEAGLIVETAVDGLPAVQAVKDKGTKYYDFVLMDIQMPILDGYEATAQIRALPGGESVPIIALSANAFKEDVDKSLACGMNAHVAKPINVKTLYETLNSLAR